MLKNKQTNYDVGDVMAFALDSGDEIVGEIVEIYDNEIVLNRPFKVHLTERGPAWFPFSFVIDQDTTVRVNIPIDKKHIISAYRCNEDSKVEYTRLTTGIEIVSGNPHKIQKS
jgi:hypothetical protein